MTMIAITDLRIVIPLTLVVVTLRVSAALVHNATPVELEVDEVLALLELDAGGRRSRSLASLLSLFAAGAAAPFSI